MKNDVRVFDITGKEVGKLPFEVVDGGFDRLFMQYQRTAAFGRRKGQAKARTRGDVSGGGKKPWRQKGTGRARQGSTRSPIWKGGGVAHGPKIHKYALEFNRDYMSKVWSHVLAEKLKGENNWVILRAADTKLKTKQAGEFLKKVFESGRTFLVVTGDANLEKAFRNLEGVNVEKINNLSPLSISAAKNFITAEADFVILRNKVDK